MKNIRRAAPTTLALSFSPIAHAGTFADRQIVDRDTGPTLPV